MLSARYAYATPALRYAADAIDAADYAAFAVVDIFADFRHC